MNTYSITDQGRQRSMNQDRYANYFHPRFTLLLLADGMGGHKAGDVAAQMAIDATREFMMEHKDRADYPQVLDEAIQEANAKIYQEGKHHPEYAHMGTTICAVLIAKEHCVVAHVGDSRIYLKRDHALYQLTKDHSLVADLTRQGVLSEEAARIHPERNTLTRAVGTDPDVEVDVDTGNLLSGDVLLLCSDGLNKMVADEEILAIIEESPSVRVACERLVEQANSNGGADNITVTLYQVGDENESDRPQ